MSEYKLTFFICSVMMTKTTGMIMTTVKSDDDGLDDDDGNDNENDYDDDEGSDNDDYFNYKIGILDKLVIPEIFPITLLQIPDTRKFEVDGTNLITFCGSRVLVIIDSFFNL